MSEAGGETLFIGVGNLWRRDDGVGPRLAAALARLGRQAVAHAGDGAGLIGLFEGRRRVVLLDATAAGLPPGSATRLDAAAGPVPALTFRNSTHRFGLAEAVETARHLGLLPEELVIHGIEGADFAPGQGLSPAVARAAGRLLSSIARAGRVASSGQTRTG